MKTTRILLLLSPLLLFVPPLVPGSDSVSMTLLGFFYSRLLRRFPWNMLMAGLCYAYAKQLGRDSFWWGAGSFVFPFLAPLILAFMPPKSGSIAAEQRRRRDVAAPAILAQGAFEDRYPLLERCLAGEPETVRREQRARFAPVRANCEFTLTLNEMADFEQQATTRRLTLWAETRDAGISVFGAGLVRSDAQEEVTAWLRAANSPGEKLTIAWHSRDSGTRYFEYR